MKQTLPFQEEGSHTVHEKKPTEWKKWNLHIKTWESILCSASALALRTSSEVDTNFGNIQDWTSGNCCASNSARGKTTLAYVACKF